MQVYFSTNFCFFPIIPVMISLAFVRLENLNAPRLGFYKWGSKNYLVIGMCKRFVGMKFAWARF